ncbi:uncharacterized protein LOC143301202 [Babylonia areolata]|uniref:uncharacterized protein LOC143301202 n=1 Tax=Babylonia areolata TaxID=304850 RepID=UPI003FCF7771
MVRPILDQRIVRARLLKHHVTMATGGSGPPTPQPQDPVTSLRDCPHCRTLCLGPVLLPCGHVLCRMCLHEVLDHQTGPGAGCRLCGQPLDLLLGDHRHHQEALTFSQIVQRLGTDPVVEETVHKALENLNDSDSDSDTHCLNCRNKRATSVCVDCHEYYCDVCAGIHLRSRASKNHVLHLLGPRALRNPSPSAAPDATRSTSAKSASSSDSVRSTDDPRSCGRGKPDDMMEWKDLVIREVGLLQRACREERQAEATLQELVSLGQEALKRARAHRRLLEMYHHRLPRLHVTRGGADGPHSYIIRGGVTSCDVTLHVQAESLKRRLSELRGGGGRGGGGRWCLDVNRLQTIRTQLREMLKSEDPQTTPDAIPPAPSAASAPSSSVPTPTSAHLPPPSIPSTSPTSSLPSPATRPSTAPTFTPPVDVMTAEPRCVFKVPPRAAADQDKPWITAVVCLPGDTLVMADHFNRKVKVMGVAPPHAVSSLPIQEPPLRLAVLSDGVVAMTTGSRGVCLMDVTAGTVAVRSHVRTARQYDGIAGHSDGHLIASCEEDSTGLASVDVLNRQGHLVRTVTDSTRLTGLASPEYLFNTRDHHVLVSDYQTDLVHRVCVPSGQVTQTFQHAHLKGPRQVCSDGSGNLYVASEDSQCVCVRSRAGDWRRLVTPSLHRLPRSVFPSSLCLTSSGHLVVSWDGAVGGSVVVGYTL